MAGSTAQRCGKEFAWFLRASAFQHLC